MIYKFLIIILVLIIVILFILFFIKIFQNYFNLNDGTKIYDVLLPIKDNGKGMNYCLNGCVRGMCNKTDLDNSCKYDFQCQYCQDEKTNMFYVDFNNDKEKEIIPIYEEEQNLNKSQTDLLNESIKNNNNYINELNNKIKMMNN